MKLFCWIGWHNWDYYTQYIDEVPIRHRQCLNCDKIQHRIRAHYLHGGEWV